MIDKIFSSLWWIGIVYIFTVAYHEYHAATTFADIVLCVVRWNLSLNVYLYALEGCEQVVKRWYYARRGMEFGCELFGYSEESLRYFRENPHLLR